MNSIEIFKTADNAVSLQVTLENETVWLTQKQMAELFDRNRVAITQHIGNIFKEGELIEEEVCKDFLLTTQHGAIKGKTQETIVKIYNLDVIISVGYRVKSQRGTQFRQWATQRLKDFLVKGYTINTKRLDELSKLVTIIEKSSQSENIQFNEVKGLITIISNYTQSFILLNQYDSNNLKTDNLNENISYEIKYNEAKSEIEVLKNKLLEIKEASRLFGNEKDDSFKGILANIVQTFDNNYLYPSIEEQAANLLYIVIKNHPFSDGNKRIGAFLFIWFLDKNRHRFKKSGELKINENGLVALALLVAQSNPTEKELMIKLIINLIKE